MPTYLPASRDTRPAGTSAVPGGFGLILFAWMLAMLLFALLANPRAETTSDPFLLTTTF
jgi:hypothetical protein